MFRCPQEAQGDGEQPHSQNDFECATDDLEFSSDGGAMYTYTPTPDGLGCDIAVTHIRVNPKGTFAADTGSGAPEFELTFRVLVN